MSDIVTDSMENIIEPENTPDHSEMTKSSENSEKESKKSKKKSHYHAVPPIKRNKSKDDSVHVTDEVFNTASHLAGTIIAVLGTVLLILKGATGDYDDKPWRIVSFSVYGATLILMFLCSTLHHGINAKRSTEELFRLFDYFAIFPLIAGTFTPICLVTLRGQPQWSWGMFGTIWGLAAIGILIKAVYPKIPKWVTNTIYLSMGWIGIILAIPFYLTVRETFGILPIVFLTLGGVFYTVGSAIFYGEWPNPIKGKFGFHEIWHIFVILGAASHYMIMYFYL